MKNSIREEVVFSLKEHSMLKLDKELSIAFENKENRRFLGLPLMMILPCFYKVSEELV